MPEEDLFAYRNKFLVLKKAIYKPYDEDFKAINLLL